MSRNIILLSDGTGNSAAKVWRTNVWRTFEALDLSGNDQVAFYDDGVGTSSFKPFAILGGAFGYGLQRNVIALYKFACRNCHNDPARDPDRIFAFGFSRGAFTIRIVIGLILSEGLVRADNETDLDRAAHDAYRRYRRKRFHTRWPGRPEDMFRNVRDGLLSLWRWARRIRVSGETSNRFTIRFVGVWDTVAAYGLPIDEMTRGVSNWIFPLALPDHEFDRLRIARGCQALALDEARTTFHPELWNEIADPPTSVDITQRRSIRDEPISQVWFPGVHSNIGGGYPDDALAYIPFVWMVTEARHCGLRFKQDWVEPRAVPDTFKTAISKRDKDGRLYDPRKGLGGYYRYGPRKLVQFCAPQFRKKEDDEVLVTRPKIHESVFKRIRNHAHAYAPVGLPPQYDVVTDAGDVLTPDQYKSAYDRNAESNEEAAHRADAQEHVWNEIWKRRIVYFLTVAATLWLLAFPFLDDPDLNAETYSSLRWASDLIRLAGQALPGFAAPWINGYALEPWTFILSAGVVAAFLWWGSLIAAQINDMMGAILQRSGSARRGKPTNWIYRLRDCKAYIWFHDGLKQRWAPAMFAFAFVYLSILAVNKIAFNAQDIAGRTCGFEVDSTPLRTPSRGDPPIAAPIDISQFCGSTHIFLEGNGARYFVEIKVGTEPQDQWMDSWISIPPGGFSSTEPEEPSPPAPNKLIMTPPWYFRPLMTPLVPLRRTLSQDWFRIALRLGSEGAEEEFYKPDIHDTKIRWVIRPKRQGELFVYVNDAVIGLPSLFDYFYRNNVGKATIEIKRL